MKTLRFLFICSYNIAFELKYRPKCKAFTDLVEIPIKAEDLHKTSKRGQPNAYITN